MTTSYWANGASISGMNNAQLRSSVPITKSIKMVAKQTERLWRRHHLTYDDVCAVSRIVRDGLGLRRPRTRQRIVDRLSRDEARRLIDHAYRASGRDGLLVKTLLFTGARVSEFVAIRVEDFFAEEHTIQILNGKGGKGRSVPILSTLAQELRTHLGDRRAGFLFETRSATGFTARRVQQIVKDAAAAAGILKAVHPHLLRHTVAQRLLDGGMALEGVQRFLGHAKIATTQVYAQSTPSAIAASYERALSDAA
jgi:integrase/recombinase XerD